jgi:hypothetical protein
MAALFFCQNERREIMTTEYKPFDYKKLMEKASILRSVITEISNQRTFNIRYKIIGEMEDVYLKFLEMNDISEIKNIYSLWTEGESTYHCLVVAGYVPTEYEDNFDNIIVMDNHGFKVVFHIYHDIDFEEKTVFNATSCILCPYDNYEFSLGYSKYGLIAIVDSFVILIAAAYACAPIGGKCVEIGLKQLYKASTKTYKTIRDNYGDMLEIIMNSDKYTTLDLIKAIGKDAIEEARTGAVRYINDPHDI